MRFTLFLPLLLLGCPTEPLDTDPGAEDLDGDGYTSDEDCDDRNNTVHPAALELCGNGIDDDCDGQIDDDGVGGDTFWPDADADGFGRDLDPVTACTAPEGFVANNADCDDQDAWSFPGGDDAVCDGKDQDCDGQIDEHAETFPVYRDLDGDGFGDPGTAREVCRDELGWVRDDTDCDDNATEVHPGAPELCDGQDQDCDRVADNGVEGSGASCPAASCLQVQELRPGATSGPYWLADGFEAYEATCDMETDGGGWTLVDLELAEARGWMKETVAGVASKASVTLRDGRLVMNPARTASEQEREGCDAALVRAQLDLPMTFETWRGDVTVAFDGDDTVSAKPGFLISGPVTGPCTEGAFLVYSGDDIAKVGGVWGESVKSLGGSREVRWSSRPTSGASMVVFELHGSNIEGRFSLVDHAEHAIVTDAEIWVR